MYKKIEEQSQQIEEFIRKNGVTKLGSSHQPMPRGEYRRYINSKHWKNKCKEIIERDGKCAGCGKAGIVLTVHHLSYENVGHENNNE